VHIWPWVVGAADVTPPVFNGDMSEIAVLERVGLGAQAGVMARGLAWERGPGYAAEPGDDGASGRGAAQAPPGPSADAARDEAGGVPGGPGSPEGLAAVLRSADPAVVGAALAVMPVDRLTRAVGAAVSPLTDEDAAVVLQGAALHVEDAAAAGICVSSLASWGARELLSVIEAAVAALGHRSLGGGLDDAALHDSWARLHRLERGVVAEKYRRLREITQRGSHLSEGARTPVDLLTRYGLTRGEAREQVDTATALGELPKTEEALARGRIGAGQAAEAGKALADAKKAKAEEAAKGDAADDAEDSDGGDEADPAFDIDNAIDDAPSDEDRRQLRERLAQQAARKSKNRLAVRDKRAHRRRYGRKYKDGDGATIQLFGPGAAIQTIWSMVEAMSGRTGAEDDRTPEQRRFDAMLHIANRYLTEGRLPDVAGQRPHVLLITTHEALHDVDGAEPATVDGFGPVSSETARMICCDAEITTVVMGEDGQPMRVGRTRYQPSRAQRRAVIARDRVCIGCGADALRCEIHHLWWWEKGGPTDIDNLALACWSCHTHIHHHGWTCGAIPTAATARAHPATRLPAVTGPQARLPTRVPTRLAAVTGPLEVMALRDAVSRPILTALPVALTTTGAPGLMADRSMMSGAQTEPPVGRRRRLCTKNPPCGMPTPWQAPDGRIEDPADPPPHPPGTSACLRTWRQRRRVDRRSTSSPNRSPCRSEHAAVPNRFTASTRSDGPPAVAQVGIGEQVPQRGGQRLGLPGRHEQPAPRILDHGLHDCAGPRGPTRHTTPRGGRACGPGPDGTRTTRRPSRCTEHPPVPPRRSRGPARRACTCSPSPSCSS
jgi:hypothetical protein